MLFNYNCEMLGVTRGRTSKAVAQTVFKSGAVAYRNASPELMASFDEPKLSVIMKVKADYAGESFQNLRSPYV